MPSLNNIATSKHLLLLFLTWFALTPCKVKESWLGVANIAYTQPLNKSATTSANSCQYLQTENLRTASQQSSKAIQHQLPVHFPEIEGFEIIEKPTIGNNSRRFYGLSPPKYILFKRLKLGLV